MKTGCYLVQDHRIPNRGLLTPVVLARPEFTDEAGIVRDWLVGVRFWNTAGNYFHYIPVDIYDPAFQDDETAGIMALPTSTGVVLLRWPTQADYDSLAASAPDGINYPPAHTDAERQAFLESIMELGQL
jgi:hypothetical protein